MGLWLSRYIYTCMCTYYGRLIFFTVIYKIYMILCIYSKYNIYIYILLTYTSRGWASGCPCAQGRCVNLVPAQQGQHGMDRFMVLGITVWPTEMAWNPVALVSLGLAGLAFTEFNDPNFLHVFCLVEFWILTGMQHLTGGLLSLRRLGSTRIWLLCSRNVCRILTTKFHSCFGKMNRKLTNHL